MAKIDYYKQFRSYLLSERALSLNTADGYERDIKQFESFHEKDLKTATPDDISEFIHMLRDTGIATSSRNRKLSSLKTFYKFMVRKNHMKINPAENIEGGKMGKRLPKPIDEQNITKLFNTVDNLRDKTLLEVLYATGARRFEVAKIKVNDINFFGKYIRIIGKGNKEREVPIHDHALMLIRELTNQHRKEYLFPSRKNTLTHISKRRINEIVEHWKDKAGLNEVDITPHKFRHSLCSHMYQYGADIKTIADIAGHESTATTENYTKINNERNRKEYEQFHPRARQA